jgi:hypothetical protein
MQNHYLCRRKTYKKSSNMMDLSYVEKAYKEAKPVDHFNPLQNFLGDYFTRYDRTEEMSELKDLIFKFYAARIDENGNRRPVPLTEDEMNRIKL